MLIYDFLQGVIEFFALFVEYKCVSISTAIINSSSNKILTLEGTN